MPTIAELFQHALHNHQNGVLPHADALYRQVIQADPDHAQAHHLLGILAHQQGNLDDAAALIGRATTLQPATAVFHAHLGMVHMDQKNFAAAAACFRAAVRLQPNDAAIRNSLGIALFQAGSIDESAESFRRAIRIDPTVADAHSNLGNVLKEQGQLTEALACYEEELRIHPDYHQARWNRSLVHLLNGDYEKGWPDFEFRSTRPDTVQRSFPMPRWDGAPLADKTILVHAEYGLGDTLQFLRFLPEVQDRGGRVVFECPTALLGLLEGAPGIDQLLPAGQEPPKCTVHIPLMSLAGILGVRLTSLPGKSPSLVVAESRSRRWREELEVLAGFKIGVVWQGNPTQEEDRFRSVPLRQFAPLANVAGIRLVSLQVGPGREQLSAAPFPIADLGARFDPASLIDLAATLPCLDLVVTVCTSVAHLAGAMGVPVWVALRHMPYWVWLLERSDSPWYPSAKLFRQTERGNWDGVFERMAQAIASFSPGSQNRR
jgi:tetratricopeptide (TPR) repeat protein